MLIPYSWLKDFVAIRKSPEELAENLSLSSIGVGGVQRSGREAILDLDVTYNRGDLLSILGVARELAALYGLELKYKPDKFIPESQLEALNIRSDTKLAKLYTLARISNLNYKTTPKLILSRLERAGMRGVNLWADLTNYMMLEFGQPFHAFDAEKVAHRDSTLSIEVRSAKKGEKIRTLDGLDRQLSETDIVIADKAGPIAVAGVMGGEETEVDEGTTEILLEAAIFDPLSIRRTARWLGLRSEASNRFEHYLSPENLYISLYKIIQMYQVYGRGKLTGFARSGQDTTEPYSVGLTYDKLSAVAGEAVPLSKARDCLERLGFKVMASERGLLCWPPHFRGDIRIPEDLAEEVLRLNGYEKVPSKPLQTTLGNIPVNNLEDWRDWTTLTLSGLGFYEVKSYPFVSTLVLSHLEKKDLLHLKNPISVEAEYLRNNLIFPLLEIAQKNSVRNERGRIFELEKVYPKSGEVLNLGTLLWGEKEPFLKAKGILEAIGDKAHLGLQFTAVKDERLHPSQTAQIKVGREVLGLIGTVHPHLCEAFGIIDAAVFEIDFEKFAELARPWGIFTPISQYPEIFEDYSFLFPQGKSLRDLVEKIRRSSPLIQQVEISDRFETKEGERSVTLKVTFQSPEKGLSDEDVKPIRNKIMR
ncbi:MAG: phenylalanine--tRNA ligase subunit beta, partial [candidate division WWE3 bacterium]|nr:phenylalanine--tRNA ligase subunit beta [candidate division WWE3 bacterium]